MRRAAFLHAFSRAVLTLPVLVLSLGIGMAQVMTSSNYQIQSDSVNVGGGFSTSTSYELESTVGEVGTGNGSSGTYALRAGYQQMQEVYLALTGAANVTLSPTIPGVSGGTANGATTVTVKTDSLAGYMLTIVASTSPAMKYGANTIADYTPAGANPDFTFTTAAADAHFGFTPEGIDIAPRYQDNGVATCGGGGQDSSSSCWDGLSTTPVTIATASGSNHPNGATTTIRFRVGVGGAVVQPAGVYVATTTVTALSL